MAKKIPIQLGDPIYFKNKSWTLSFNFNTKSWVSFHSYLPNFYIAENNFFYSGLNDCCGDFDFIVTELPDTLDCTIYGYALLEGCELDCSIEGYACFLPTTTTTSTTVILPTTTSTTTLFGPCSMEGEAKEVCLKSGEITTTTTTTECVRPSDLNIYSLITGYVVDEVAFDSTTDQYIACAVMTWLGDNPSVTRTHIYAESYGIYVNSFLYMVNGTDDCECVPDGWYFTDVTMYYGYVFHVENCIITEIYECEISTTTTTTIFSSTTTTTTLDCSIEGEVTEVCTTTTTTSTVEPTTTTSTTTLEPTTTTTTSSSSTTTTTIEPTTTTTTTEVTTTTTTSTTSEPTTTTTTTTVAPTTTTTTSSTSSTTTTTTVEPTTTTTTTTTTIEVTTTTTTLEPTTTTTTTRDLTCDLEGEINEICTTTTTTSSSSTTTTTTTSEPTTSTTTTTICPIDAYLVDIDCEDITTTTTSTTVEITTTTTTSSTSTTTIEPITTTTTSSSSTTTTSTTIEPTTSTTTTGEPTTTTTTTTVFACNINYSIDEIDFVTTTTTTTLEPTTTTTSSTSTTTTTTLEEITTTTTTTTLESVEGCVEYGLLYNWYAATDERNITSSDDWIVPSQSDLATLDSFLASSQGCKLKESGLTYWDYNNLGTNEVGFNARGGGYRWGGEFSDLKSTGQFWTSTQYESSPNNICFVLYYSSCDIDYTISSMPYEGGCSIRLLYTGEGTPTSYTGNDGKEYIITLIGTQYWLAENLIETKYRNGNLISFVEDNTEWAALTTGAVCAYNNDYSLVGCDFTLPTTTTTTTIE